jgi:hypothetical protein
MTIGVDILKLAKRRGNDIEYYCASCTAAEAATGGNGGAGINDFHVHPMEPCTLRITLRLQF